MLMIDYTFTCQNSRKKANKLELKNALNNVHIAPGQQFNLVNLWFLSTILIYGDLPGIDSLHTMQPGV
jgi:hypothetical protein